MIDVKILIWLLFSHWIADFVCQNDWMAVNKSKNVLALLLHVGVYTAAMLLGFAEWFGFPNPSIPNYAFSFIGFTALFHFVTDAITSNITSYLWEKEERHWFFVMIGFDQLLHYVQLILTYQWLSK